MALGQPTRDRRAERHAATRTEIVSAAWDLVREHGLAGLSLRDVAKRVGMQPPSLYSYFPSKHAIYDAMFAEGYEQALVAMGKVPAVVDRETFKRRTRAFIRFCLVDPARYQLLFQRTIPGFVPSAASYAPAVELLGLAKKALADIGVTDPKGLDVYTAIVTGLTDQQLSNDPGGDRWVRLLDDVIDMFIDRFATGPAAPAATGQATSRRRRRS